MEFSIDKLADIINGLIVNILSACLIFWYLWFTRKIPSILVAAKYENSGGSMTSADGTPVWVSMKLTLTINNESIYNVFNCKLSILSIPFSNVELKDISPNIPSNETDTSIAYFVLENPLQLDKAAFFESIKPMLEKPIVCLVSYRNDENRKFEKQINARMSSNIILF